MCYSGFFVFLRSVKIKPPKRAHLLIAAVIVVATCLLRFFTPELLERVELMTYDMRVRHALKRPFPAATNLGFVFIDENTIEHVRRGTFGYHHGLYWPRSVYARVVQELSDQGAALAAFDVLFGELRGDHSAVQMADGSFKEADDFFALTLRQCSNSILAVTADLTIPPLFATNALALGDISTERDKDGVLRRVKLFRTYKKWHPAFLQLEAEDEYLVDLSKARIYTNQIVLPRLDLEDIVIPLRPDGCFDLADFIGEKIPPGMERWPKPFTEQRVWHMGIVLAAQVLGLDLNQAEVDLPHGRVVLRGANATRVIPVDDDGTFYIDWALTLADSRLTRQPAHELLWQNRVRLEGGTNALSNLWRDKLAIIGSSALANDLTDRGQTPLSKETLLVSKHWNVANSILSDRFIRRSAPWVDCGIIILLSVLAGVLTCKARVVIALPAVLALGLIYAGVCSAAYTGSRLWVPFALPALGAMSTQLGLLAWLVTFERAEKRRVRSVFSKMVPPTVVNELLALESLALGGTKVEVSVFFADVRGFTELTVRSQKEAHARVRAENLTGAAAQACFEQHAVEVLSTVNAYLDVIAQVVRSHDGTLDKFIGDCVMAYWGAPKANPQHAVACVRAAIHAQRAIEELNRQRDGVNRRRAVDAGRQAHSPLPLLSLGSGINTGQALAGLMGSAQAECLSYTVFGREVNLASRLESASGHGRIFISEATYRHLLRDDPGLARACTARDSIRLKGFDEPVPVFEVSWREPAPGVAEASAQPEAQPVSIVTPSL